MIKILKYLRKKEILLSLIVLAFIILQVYLDLTLPEYMNEITILVQSSGSKIRDILIAGGWMLACAIGSLIASVVVAVVASRIASNFSYYLRKHTFDKVTSFSKEEISDFSTSSLITRTTNDITQVQLLVVMGLQVLIKAPITAIWAINKILDKNITWTYAVIISVIVLLSVVAICIFLVAPKFKKIQKLTDDLNRTVRENLTGLSVVRAYNAEEYQEDKFSRVNEEFTFANIFTNRVLSFMMPSIQIIMNGLILSIYIIGAILINEAVGMEKNILFADMLVFSSYAIQIIMSFMMLVMIFILLPRSMVSAKRILEVLDTKLSIKDGTNITGNPKLKGEVVFENVSFKYPDSEDYVLKDISFTASKGDVIAFIGATGSGKSTVINLIPRFFDTTKGRILVEGIDVRDYKLSILRNKIGYISQKAILFKGTIESNVAYGSKDNEEKMDVEKAVKIAGAHEFVSNMENTYEADVFEAGSNLSGGQKQRVSIARAVYKSPDIFIFDDSFSALDYKTDRMLRDTLDNECSTSTRIIVAQRIGTIKNATKIIVLEDGIVVGMGTHQELMNSCEVYKEIAYSQLSKEELA